MEALGWLFFHPNYYAFVIGPWGQEVSVGRKPNNIGIVAGFQQSVQNFYVEFSALIDDLPNFDASLSALFFLVYDLLVGSCCGHFIAERVEIDGQHSVFLPMPTHIGGLYSHF